MTESHNYPVESVMTTFRILECMKGEDGIRIQEIADILDIPKSTVFRHLKTLEDYGYLVNDDGEYFVGTQFLELSVLGGRWRSLYENAKPVVDDLAEDTNERVTLGVPEQDQAAVIYYSEGNNAIGTDVHIGSQFQLHCTAIGKILLAYLPQQRREEILSKCELTQMTERTITDRSELRDELEEIREAGVAYDDRERLNGVRGVATPILNRSEDQLVGGLTIAGAPTSIRGDRFREEIPDLLQRASDKIEMDLQYK